LAQDPDAAAESKDRPGLPGEILERHIRPLVGLGLSRRRRSRSGTVSIRAPTAEPSLHEAPSTGQREARRELGRI
jgi:hypothetical protein